MSGSNAVLHSAARARNDEFYTQLADIEKEMQHYADHFFGKTVFCNCDDPRKSNFFRYFARHFHALGLKKLIATCHDGSGGQHSLLPNDASRCACKLELTGMPNPDADGISSMHDIDVLLQDDKFPLRQLHGNGDFRSQECLDLLKQSDIVVTNPPFSLFREFIAQLVQYKKKFLVIGNKNAVTCKDIFQLVRQNEIGFGYNAGAMTFAVPAMYSNNTCHTDEHGQKWTKMGNICWFTNLHKTKMHALQILSRKYDPEQYPAYDNYRAVNVSRTADIPCDYDGVMGVPLTFMDMYNPRQFEILGLASGRKEFDVCAWPVKRYVNPVQHNRDGSIENGSKINTSAVFCLKKKPDSIYYTADNADGFLCPCYARILIRRK